MPVRIPARSRSVRNVLVNVRPIPDHLIEPGKYQKIIERLVYPPPESLNIELIHTAPSRGILVIEVPKQPPEVRPVLVLGAIAGDRILGAHVSIVRRVGDETVATHPVAIHSLIAAGRVALGEETRGE